MIRALRRLVYRLGFRPKSTSLLYSPSAAWWYAMRDVGTGVAQAMQTARAMPIAVQRAADLEAAHAAAAVTRESRRDTEQRPEVDPSHDWEWITPTRGECQACGSCSDCDSDAFEPCVMRLTHPYRPKPPNGC